VTATRVQHDVGFDCYGCGWNPDKFRDTAMYQAIAAMIDFLDGCEDGATREDLIEVACDASGILVASGRSGLGVLIRHGIFILPTKRSLIYPNREFTAIGIGLTR
jgi:hypothetical protein